MKVSEEACKSIINNWSANTNICDLLEQNEWIEGRESCRHCRDGVFIGSNSGCEGVVAELDIRYVECSEGLWLVSDEHGIHGVVQHVHAFISLTEHYLPLATELVLIQAEDCVINE